MTWAIGVGAASCGTLGLDQTNGLATRGRLPATDDGRIHLFAHTHLFRKLGANAYLPSATAASDFARRHDLIGGEWHSGSDQIPQWA